MSALLLLSLLAAPADAGVADEYGGLIVNVMNATGFPCGTMANIVQNIDRGWECSLVGADNGIIVPPACASALDAACVDIGGNDADGDGYTIDDRDCDDDNPEVYPFAPEYCDGVDNDCLDGVDNDPVDGATWYRDADEDGYGAADDTLEACEQPEGYTDDDTDCDDADPTTFPWAGDAYGDGIDSDCDGLDCEAVSEGDSYFALCFGDLAWHDARAACQDGGYSDLASVDSADDQAALEGLLESAGVWSSSAAWIGYADELVEGSWGWADGSSGSYTNWSSGEPNNSGGYEDCAELNWPLESGGWNDGACYDYSPGAYFCEL
jgi:hypothetical protein